MNLTRRWASGTIDELNAGMGWYDEQQPGLGADFVKEALAAVDRAMRTPEGVRRYEHPGLQSDLIVRKIQLRRFREYGVVFTVIDDTFWVLAVAHAKRRPGYWGNRASRL